MVRRNRMIFHVAMKNARVGQIVTIAKFIEGDNNNKLCLDAM